MDQNEMRAMRGMPQSVRLSEWLGSAAWFVKDFRRFICWALFGCYGGPGWRYLAKVLALMLLAATLVLRVPTGLWLPVEAWSWMTELAKQRQELRQEECQIRQ